ncbi:torsin-1A-like [Micropterus dolomieu]|uniref:torsin-1A-like n=1 Tax=Micropterus dolomieu TaxID=147949 RepID=UPI001E8D779D|nr:torsin-1A-like [Micropterus dolomieu]
MIWNYLQTETCDPKWTAINAAGLQADLESNLFGQHIASRIVLKAVSGFMSNDNPKKPLVLSLHGWTGTGKTYVSKLIAENIYKKGMDSSFVHIFISSYHFPHKSEIKTYKSQLQQRIKDSVTNCARSIFIFDEMDKMHPGLIDSIKPFLEYHNNLDGVSFRKAIFIFLSNGGGELIKQTAFDFWKAQRGREEIELKDLETSISESAFKNGGLWNSDLIYKNLVDFFVPFLPLEKRHVIQCIKAAMRARGCPPDQNVADKMVEDLVYVPKPESVFSAKGCKTIESKLDYYFECKPLQDAQG